MSENLRDRLNILNYHLGVLDLKPGATRKDVKEAYRDLTKVWHPDRFQHDSRMAIKAQEKLKGVISAYIWIQQNEELFHFRFDPRNQNSQDSDAYMGHKYQRNNGGSEVTQTPTGAWWRWLLMPFACLIGAPVGAFLFALIGFWATTSVGLSPDGWYQKHVAVVYNIGFLGFLWAYISYRVAPSARVIASTVMTTILIVLMTILMLLMLLMNKAVEYRIGQNFEGILQTIAVLVGAILAINIAHKKDEG